jgi:hypothetical protein
MFKVGFAGTAKNTGKTTALMYFLQQAFAGCQRVGLSGIGYDGEDLDHLTGLPKPRVFCPRGTIIATAQRCLARGTASCRLLEVLPVSNALGPICLAEVVNPGLAVIAGPNKRGDLRRTLKAFARGGCELVFVDGAFGRMSPFVEVDGLILATGAARNRALDCLVRETRALDRIFTLPAAVLKGAVEGENTIVIWGQGGGTIRFRETSLLSPELVQEVARAAASAEVISLPGAVPGRLLGKFSRELGEDLAGKTLIVSDPTKLLVLGEYVEAAAALDQIAAFGGRVMVRERIPLLAVTINPFYPREVNNTFCKDFIDENLLKQALAAVTRVPVINVREGGPAYYLDTARREVVTIDN